MTSERSSSAREAGTVAFVSAVLCLFFLRFGEDFMGGVALLSRETPLIWLAIAVLPAALALSLGWGRPCSVASFLLQSFAIMSLAFLACAGIDMLTERLDGMRVGQVTAIAAATGLAVALLTAGLHLMWRAPDGCVVATVMAFGALYVMAALVQAASVPMWTWMIVPGAVGGAMLLIGAAHRLIDGRGGAAS